MKDSLLLDTKEIGDYRIQIYYDDDNCCPVTDWDMGGGYLFEHLEYGGYHLSSYCNWKDWVSDIRYKSMSDLLQRMAAEVVEQKDIIDYYKAGKVKDMRFVYNRSEHQWELQAYSSWRGKDAQWIVDKEFTPSELKVHDYRMELLESLDEDDLVALIQECAKDFVIKEWSSSGYCQGDHMRGIAYMSKERFDKRCGFNPERYSDWKEQAMSVIDGEVKCIGMWAWGDVKGFVLEKKVPFTKTYADGRVVEDFEWEQVDSCWGYYLETEELIQEVIAEHDLKEVA